MRFNLLLLTVVSAGCGKPADPPAAVTQPLGAEPAQAKPDQPKDTPGPKQTADKEVPVPVYSAEAFYKLAKSMLDDEAVFERHKGKLVEVTGEVEFVGRTTESYPHLMLKVEGHEFLGVMCRTVDPEPWVKVAPGQKVRIKGRCPDFLSVLPCLLSGEVVEASEYTAIRLTALDLAKEQATNSKLTESKYYGKPMVVTGEVLSIEKTDPSLTRVKLASGNEVSVTLIVDRQNKVLFHKTEKGQKVQIFGTCLAHESLDDVTLISCVPISSK